jgi:hypothetical protein
MRPPGIGHDIFGKAAGGRGHNAVPGLDPLHFTADRLDFACALQAEPRADAADAAVLVAQGDEQIRPVEA